MKPKHIRAWFEKSLRDIAIAKHNLTADPPFTDSAVFHCQQAVEKALKGFLAFHKTPFSKTHDIGQLSELVKKIDPSLDSVLFQCSELTPYATVFRYPGEPIDPSLEEANDSIILAQSALDQIVSRLPKEISP